MRVPSELQGVAACAGIRWHLASAPSWGWGTLKGTCMAGEGHGNDQSRGGPGTELSAQRKPVLSPAVLSDIGTAGTWGRCAGHSSTQMQPPAVTGTEVIITGGGPHGLGLQGGREAGGGWDQWDPGTCCASTSKPPAWMTQVSCCHGAKQVPGPGGGEAEGRASRSVTRTALPTTPSLVRDL